MKHHTITELEPIADVNWSLPATLATRNQRIERWASVLDRNPARCLAALTETEHLHPAVRDEARAAGSALTIAFEDPMLRAAGLKSDTYGEAMRFFELSHWQLHDVVCSCHVGATMRADWAANRIRRMIGGGKFSAWLKALFVH